MQYTKKESDILEIDERRIEREPYPTEPPHWKKVADAIQGVFNKKPPQYLSDNPYLCKPDE